MDIRSNSLVLYHVLYFTEYDTTLNYCFSHREGWLIYQDDLFWIEKARLNLGISRDRFRKTNLTPARRYLQLLSQKDGLAFNSYRYMSMDTYVLRAITYHRDDLVEHAIKNLGYIAWDLLVSKYAQRGDKDLTCRYLNDRNLNVAATGALRGGHRELFKYICSRTFFHYTWEKKHWVYASAGSGDRNLFDDMLESVSDRNSLEWEECCRYAIQAHDRVMLNYIVSLATVNWARLAEYAARFDERAIFDQAVGRASLDWSKCAELAMIIRSRKWFDYIRSKAPPNHVWEWQYISGMAAASEDRDLFDYVLSLIAADTGIDWNLLASCTAASRDTHLFDHIMSLIPPKTQIDWNRCVRSAVRSDCMDMLKHIFSLSPFAYNWQWNDILNSAAQKLNVAMFNYLCSLFPSRYGINWKRIMLSAIEQGNAEFMRCVINHVPADYIGRDRLERLLKNSF